MPREGRGNRKSNQPRGFPNPGGRRNPSLPEHLNLPGGRFNRPPPFYSRPFFLFSPPKNCLQLFLLLSLIDPLLSRCGPLEIIGNRAPIPIMNRFLLGTESILQFIRPPFFTPPFLPFISSRSERRGDSRSLGTTAWSVSANLRVNGESLPWLYRRGSRQIVAGACYQEVKGL